MKILLIPIMIKVENVYGFISSTCSPSLPNNQEFGNRQKKSTDPQNDKTYLIHEPGKYIKKNSDQERGRSNKSKFEKLRVVSG